MTNDAKENQIKIFDWNTGDLLQTLNTKGKGGVSGNQGGVRQYKDKLVAVVNNGSDSVSIFGIRGGKLFLYKVLKTASAPVSVAFGNDHLYVAGVNTVESFELDSFKQDSKVNLLMADSSVPPIGATSQVGVAGRKLLVTLKADPNPGTVDVIHLCRHGKLSGVTAVLAPAGSLTPFGFSVLADKTALITLAHSNQVGLFKDSQFVSVITLDQVAPCWSSSFDKYVYTVNAGSGTVSRLISTGSNIFVDDSKAASIPGGSPTDSDINVGRMVVLDHNATTSELNCFEVDEFGVLTAKKVLDAGVANANGVALLYVE
jgi:hypothetical protein